MLTTLLLHLSRIGENTENNKKNENRTVFHKLTPYFKIIGEVV